MNRSVRVGFACFLVSSLALASCKKESQPPAAEKAEPSAPKDHETEPKPAKPIEPLPDLELARSAPDGDRFMILFRFDQLRAHDLAPAAESIIAPLPDYKRVFGARNESEHGDLIGDVFSTVVLTTADPRGLTATTLAARGPFEAAKMRAMLAYSDSGISWAEAQGGPVAAITKVSRFSWDEPRVFLMPAPEWIVLAHPANLAGLSAPLTPAEAKRREKLANKGSIKPPTADLSRGWPAWLRQAIKTDADSRKPSKLGELLVTAHISGMTQMGLPNQLGQFETPIPKSATIAAFAKDGVVSFRGSLQFDEPPTAERFVAVANAAKLALAVKDVAAALPPGSLEALRKMSFYQDGRDVRWKTTASKDDTRKMCQFSAEQSKRLMGGMFTR